MIVAKDKGVEFMAKYYTNDRDNQVIVEYENKEIVDQETGEIVPVYEVTKKYYGGNDFHKCFLESFLASFEMFQYKQINVVCYIYEHMQTSNNIFIGTYKSISQALNVSEPTIASVMRKLQANNFIRRVQNGIWQINPNILMKGDERKRKIMITKFENLDQDTRYLDAGH